MAARAPVIQRQLTQPNLSTRVFRALVRLGSVLVLALVFSVVMEWVGMTWWWPEEGVGHSERMLVHELQYLNDNFKQSILRAPPVVIAQRVVTWVRHSAEAIGFSRFIAWLRRSANGVTGARRFASNTFPSIQYYLEAMLNVVQTFSVRLLVLTLATPVFGLCGLVGFVEGLMRRDLRRWGGGRESSFVYHHGKKILGPSILLAWMLYLATPFSLHPSVVLLPFAAAFGFGAAVTAATFKKYL